MIQNIVKSFFQNAFSPEYLEYNHVHVEYTSIILIITLNLNRKVLRIIQTSSFICVLKMVAFTCFHNITE